MISNLTHCPGVYLISNSKGEVIYVGKAKDLRRRVGSYFQGRAQDTKTMAMLSQVANIDVTVTQTESEALILEYNLIKEHRPRFNILLRDDKSYPYIHVSTDHDFPRLTSYRRPRKIAGRHFGPYPSASAVKEALSQLQKIFKIRQCEDSYFSNRTRPCLQYQIQRCTAPCVGLISSDDYQRDIEHALLFLQGDSGVITEKLAKSMDEASEKLEFEIAAEYRDKLSKLKEIESLQLVSRASGNFDVVGLVYQENLCCITVMCFRSGRLLGSNSYFPRMPSEKNTSEIMRSFLLQYYGGREAPSEILLSEATSDAEALAEMLGNKSKRRVLIKYKFRGDRARWIEMALTNANHAADLKAKSSASLLRQYKSLTEILNLGKLAHRLECFDISHMAGGATVGSCVVFGTDGPVKADYRRFNVTDITPGDDYGALAQVIKRRYLRIKKGEASIPDVLLVDGGQGQLSAAASVLKELQLENVMLVAIAKGQDRKPGRESLYLRGISQAIKLPANSPALYLIQKIRDEAHRFAIEGHKARRKKQQYSSPLDGINGLGPKRRRALLRNFGGLQAITRASVDDLMKVKGISRRLGRLIYSQFHSD
ncbi:MAG: excinuclease ABC subunit UvrC, partial [Gammaproteobacteria bacterium]|nr:excinuclease ABC subunit UvrC [Gammaproteobacteria bacterium]